MLKKFFTVVVTLLNSDSVQNSFAASFFRYRAEDTSTPHGEHDEGILVSARLGDVSE